MTGTSERSTVTSEAIPDVTLTLPAGSVAVERGSRRPTRSWSTRRRCRTSVQRHRADPARCRLGPGAAMFTRIRSQPKSKASLSNAAFFRKSQLVILAGASRSQAWWPVWYIMSVPPYLRA
jgi:hypothetical protein